MADLPAPPEATRSAAASSVARLVRAIATGMAYPSIRMASVILLTVIVAAVLADLLPLRSPTRMNMVDRLSPPLTPGYLLGTDHLGRDQMSRLVFGARLSLAIGFGVIVATCIGGLFVGMVAGLFHRWDQVLMRLMDALMSLPAIVLAIAIMAVLGRSLFNVILALTIVYTPRMARVVRSTVIQTRSREYVLAATALGGSTARLMWVHILPNCLPAVIVQATFFFANAVLAESALSFLGLGVDPSVPSWGVMLNEGRNHMRLSPWLTLLPGGAIMLFVLALNLLGDGLRDATDPSLKPK